MNLKHLIIFLICFVGVFGYIHEALRSKLRMSHGASYRGFDDSTSDEFDLSEILRNLEYDMDGGYLIGCIKLPIRKPNPKNTQRQFDYTYSRHGYDKRKYRF